MRTKELNLKLFQGIATLAVLTAEVRVAATFKIEGLQTVNFNLGGHWYEIRRNSYPSEDTFTLYEIVYVSGTA